jgi:hypothetical protein
MALLHFQSEEFIQWSGTHSALGIWLYGAQQSFSCGEFLHLIMASSARSQLFTNRFLEAGAFNAANKVQGSDGSQFWSNLDKKNTPIILENHDIYLQNLLWNLCRFALFRGFVEAGVAVLGGTLVEVKKF